jgi:hypothetical protein
MSIYASLWQLKFPQHGDFYWGCEWVEVWAQGVPAHIGTPTPGHGYEDGDPYAAFLPPAIEVPPDDDGRTMRAVVVITAGTPKVVQEYKSPLLVLSGREYESLPFAALHERICDALRGDRPRVMMEFCSGDGRRRLILEDGSIQELPPSDGAKLRRRNQDPSSS